MLPEAVAYLLTASGFIRSENMKKNRQERKETLAACIFLAPNILGFIAITLLPVLASLFFSFTEWRLVDPPRFNGIANHLQMLTDERFWMVMGNTLYFTIGTVPIGMALALFFSLLLNQEIRGVYIYRAIFFMPVVSSVVAVTLLWRWLLARDIGLIYYLLSLVGISPPDFLHSVFWPMPSVIVMSIWRGLGFNIVLFLAGLQGISRVYYEAAVIDGANSWQKLRYITIPLISPTTFFIFVMSLISSFQVFDQVFILTAGGPAFRTTTIVYYIYLNGFVWFNMGYASAMAWVLFTLVLIVTLFQWKMQERWVFYEQ